MSEPWAQPPVPRRPGLIPRGPRVLPGALRTAGGVPEGWSVPITRGQTGPPGPRPPSEQWGPGGASLLPEGTEGGHPTSSRLDAPTRAPSRGPAAQGAPRRSRAPPRDRGGTYVEELLGGGDGDAAQRVLVLLVHHLVTVHALGLVQPEADQVQRRFQDLGGGEQDALRGGCRERRWPGPGATRRRAASLGREATLPRPPNPGESAHKTRSRAPSSSGRTAEKGQRGLVGDPHSGSLGAAVTSVGPAAMAGASAGPAVHYARGRARPQVLWGSPSGL